MKDDIHVHKIDISSTKDELRAALKKISVLENNLSAANEKISDAERSNLELGANLKNAQKDVQLIQDQLRDEKNKTFMLEVRSSTSNNNPNDSNSSVVDTLQKFHNESEITKLTNELNNIRNDYKESSKECIRLREQNTALKNSNFQLDFQLKNQKNACDALVNNQKNTCAMM